MCEFCYYCGKITYIANKRTEIHHFLSFIPMFGSTMLLRASYAVDDQSDLRRGRIESSLLPQEVLLWRLTENLKVRHSSWRLTKKNFFRTSNVSPCTWAGIACNDNKSVVTLDMSAVSRYKMEGNLTWENLPQTIVHVNVANQGLQGTMDTRLFPPGLNFFSSMDNWQSGPIDLSQLPVGITIVRFNKNAHTEYLDLTSLPDTLRQLNVSSNLFIGEINLDSLPASLRRLELSNNRLYGTLGFNELHRRYPSDIRKDESERRKLKNRFVPTLAVDLSNNYFYKYVPEGVLPKGITYGYQNFSN